MRISGENYRITAPENFNFGYDIVDEYARLEPSKPALIWLNDAGEEKHFTFGDVKEQSDRIANLLCSLGIRKGDRVLLILKQRPEGMVHAGRALQARLPPLSRRLSSSRRRI